jgi:large subunit ribosomal protein L21
MSNILVQIFLSTGEIIMYAIIESGGKQYRIAQGEKVRIEKVPGNADDEVSLGAVLAIDDGERLLVGAPYVQGASVTGKIVAQGRARKVTVFKYKRRKDSKKKKGHRQAYTELIIEKIEVEAQHGA